MIDRIAVGHLVGVFGVKGWIKVKSNTEPPENIINYAPWWLRTPHGLKQVEVDDYSHRPQGLMVHIKGCDDRDKALAYGKAVIEIDGAQLPKLDANEYYWRQLVGLQVITLYNGGRQALGEVKELFETGANDVLVVVPNEHSIDDRERLVPYLPGQFVSCIDLESGVMEVDWDPEF
ncbi:MAG: ribosome maturation factor RimM [Marinagarivorans sp.]|nr:ribosome maturation factor RimM [Marinagarivorans sp.]